MGNTMRHLSYNIAGSNTLERIPNFNLNANKRTNIKAIIREVDPDTFGVQEAPRAWIEGMVGLLDDVYAMVGGYSEEIGENEKFWYNPLYYKRDKFRCHDNGVIFLNETFKYNNSSRNCAFALLERMADGKLILLLSLHLEHRALGSENLEIYNFTNYNERTAERNILRDSQVRTITKIVEMKREMYAQMFHKEVSVIVSGDFNINRWEDESYEHEYSRLVDTMRSVGLYDSVTRASSVVANQTNSGWRTYRGCFTAACPDAGLDYIFLSDDLTADSFAVYDTKADMEDSSDHHPVFADYYA